MTWIVAVIITRRVALRVVLTVLKPQRHQLRCCRMQKRKYHRGKKPLIYTQTFSALRLMFRAMHMRDIKSIAKLNSDGRTHRKRKILSPKKKDYNHTNLKSEPFFSLLFSCLILTSSCFKHPQHVKKKNLLFIKWLDSALSDAVLESARERKKTQNKDMAIKTWINNAETFSS